MTDPVEVCGHWLTEERADYGGSLCLDCGEWLPQDWHDMDEEAREEWSSGNGG